MEASVSEIHRYPVRPPGFVEPLFETPESRREIAEHLLRAAWLLRASEIEEKSGSTVHATGEQVQLQRYPDGRVEIVRAGARRCSWRRRRIVEVLARWREVRSWWREDERVDRLLFRVVLSDGAIVDLALDRSGPRSGGWALAGIVD